MAHLIESMVSGRKIVPWHGLGTVVAGLMTLEEVIIAAKINREVIKAPLYARMPDGSYIEVTDKMATVRDDGSKVYGVVGSGYEMMQIPEMGSALDILNDSGEAVFDTAGELQNGIFWLTAKVPNGNNPDMPEKYLVARTGFDGKTATDIFFSGIRPVCWNTLSAAFDGKANSFSIRHTKNSKEAFETAKNLITESKVYFSQMEDVFSKMHEKKFTPDMLTKVIREVYKVKEKTVTLADIVAATENANTVEMVLSNRNANLIEDIIMLSEIGKGTEIAGVKGTAWGAYNAITEYADHFQKANESKKSLATERRFFDAHFGKTAGIKENALEIILEMVNIAA